MSLDLKSLNAVVSALNQLYSVAEQSGRTVTASSLGYPFMGSSYGGTPTFSFAKVDSSGVLYVNATSVGNPNINIAQVLGAVPSSSNPLAVELTDGAAYYDSRQIRALTSADVVTANQGGTWNIGTVTTVTTVSTVTAVTTVSTVTAVTTVGTVTTLSQFPSTAALADTTSNPTLTEIACFNMGFNGTTWDRLRSDTNKYLYVDVANSTLAVTQSGAWTVAATQSGSWTVAATQSGTWNIGIVTTVTSITNPVAVTQSGTWTVARSWTLSSATDSVSAV